MPRYRLTAKFQVNDSSGTSSIEAYDEVIDCDDQKAAKECLDAQISKMISSYSNQSQDWTLIEMNVSLFADEDPVQKKDLQNGIMLL